MRILSLHLRAYGPFTDLLLELEQAPAPRLHLIYGPNEAGKSSTLRAIRRFLFGFAKDDSQSSVRASDDDFRHDRNRLRIGASLWNRQEQILSAVRRASGRNSLWDAADLSPLPNDALDPFLHGLTREQFETLWSIDHVELRQGGEAILQGQGEIGQLLFASGLGLTSLRELCQFLQDRADDLFKPQGRTNPQINKTLNDIKRLEQERRRVSLSSREWEEHDRALRNAQEQLEQVKRERAEAAAERTRCDCLLRGLEKHAQLCSVERELQELAKVPLLEADLAERRTQAIKNRAAVQSRLQSVADRRQQLQNKLASLTVPDAVLDASDEITALSERWGAVKQQFDDCSRLQGELSVLLAELEDDQTWLGRNVVAAVQSQPTAVDKARLIPLIQEHARLHETIRRAADQLAECERELDALPTADAAPAPPLADMDACLDQVQAIVPTEEALLKTQKEIEQLTAPLKEALPRLSGWQKSLTELAAWPPPAAEVIDRFQEEFAALDQRADRLQRDLSAKERERTDKLAQLNAWQATGIPPGECDLQTARQRRDEQLSATLAAWEQGQPFSLAQAQQTLKTVAEADHVADRLRHEAQQVAAYAQLQAAVQALTTECEQQRAASQACQAERSKLQEQWRSYWPGVDLQGRSPADMRRWLNDYHDIMSQLRLLEQKRRSWDQLREQLADALRQAHDRAAALAAPPLCPGETVAAWYSRLKNHRQTLQDAADQHRDHQTRRQTLAEQQRRTRAEYDHAVAELAQWQTRWAEVLTPLGLPPDLHPTQADALFTRLEQVWQRDRQRRQLERQIEISQQAMDSFSHQVRELVQRLGADGSGSPADLVASLQRCLRHAQQAAQDRDRYAGELAELEQTYQHHHEELARFDAELADLLRLAEVESEGQFSVQIERSRRKQELLRQQNELVTDLNQLAAATGQDLPSFRMALQTASAPALSQKRDQAAERQSALEQELERLNKIIGQERTLLDAMNGNDRAADLEASRCALLAKLEADVIDYQRTKLAAEILDRAIQRYRERHQNAVLIRTGQLFRELTLGSFTDVIVQTDDRSQQAVLLGLRAGEQVPVAGMSDGTRDQLYLALRLASLELYLDHHEPVPLVLDDILVHFDDDRAAAALSALAELSQRTQVLFFTHHQHLVELARRHLPAERLCCHHLPGPETPPL